MDLSVTIEQPRQSDFGEIAVPAAFQLAKRLRQAPKKIAAELAAEIGPIPGVAALEVAGNGYINLRLDRGAYAAALLRGEEEGMSAAGGKIIVEHTNINPNKAAHIGHLRNATLGDTFVRMLRASGAQVEVQNYIDNTGVQVADVVVGFHFLEHKTTADVEALLADPAVRFDYYCWDLYAHTSSYYKEQPESLAWRSETLHAIEAGEGELARMAHLVADAVVQAHLKTMLRLDVEYDVLPRESEILHLQFWAAAFEQLKQRKAIYLESEGKNAGCWVMPGLSEEGKVIVRSNGTVTYVGKDIAYHLWKFGLLGLDFGYRKFSEYADGRHVWISCDPKDGEPGAPHFGGVDAIYNVIDARQSEPQETVKQAILLMGNADAAARYTHFSYEMVALTPRCAMELGYTVSEEDQKRSYIEVSGRKGFGVKADDLLDKLIDAAQNEVDTRHPELEIEDRREIAAQIAVGALRYFMLKFTKPSVIAFDFKDALSFEGDTGPYAQYAVVRASNIFRKGGLDPESFCRDAACRVSTEDFAKYLNGESGNDIWELWLAAAKTSTIVSQCIATTEPAYLAKHAFQLAQLFSTFYHRYPILSEADEGRKKFLLATAAVVRRELIRVLAAMGIGVPPVM